MILSEKSMGYIREEAGDNINSFMDMACKMWCAINNGNNNIDMKDDKIGQDLTFIHAQITNAAKNIRSKEQIAANNPNKVRCLLCQAEVVILKKHLKQHGMTINQYKETFGQVCTVPASYSKARSQLAKQLGLGEKGSKKALATGSIGDL